MPEKLAPSQTEIAAYNNLAELLSNYSNTSVGKILHVSSNTPPPTDKLKMGNALVHRGLSLMHCSVAVSDNFFPIQKLGNGAVYVPNPEYKDIDFVNAIGEVTAEASNSWSSPKNKNILEAVQPLYEPWANERFGLPFNEEFKRIAFNEPVIILVWDHHKSKRPLFGDLWRIPKESKGSLFNIWKMSEFPLSIFVSDRSENDTKAYVRSVAAEIGDNWRAVLRRAIEHEYFHNHLSVPMGYFLLTETENWWHEAVTITYTDLPNYNRRRQISYDEAKRMSIEQIMEDGTNYIANLSLWLSICAVHCSSLDPSQIMKASDDLVLQMIHRAVDRGEKLDPKIIPQFLLSKKDGKFNHLQKTRVKILDGLRQGIFPLD